MVPLETDTRSESEESLFVVWFVVYVLNACLVGKVHRENTALVNLAEDREIVEVRDFFAQWNFVPCNCVEVYGLGAAVRLVYELLLKVGQRGLSFEPNVDLVNKVEAHVAELVIPRVFQRVDRREVPFRVLHERGEGADRSVAKIFVHLIHFNNFLSATISNATDLSFKFTLPKRPVSLADSILRYSYFMPPSILQTKP